MGLKSCQEQIRFAKELLSTKNSSFEVKINYRIKHRAWNDAAQSVVQDRHTRPAHSHHLPAYIQLRRIKAFPDAYFTGFSYKNKYISTLTLLESWERK